MKKRVITGAIIVAVLVLALVLRQVNAYIFDALILILSIAATIEISKCVTIGEDKTNKLTTLICSICNTVLTFGIFLALLLTDTIMYLPEFILSLFVCFSVLIIVSLIKYKKFVNLKFFFPLVYPTYLFLFFYLINHLDVFNAGLNSNVSLYILVSIFIISMLTDTFAMLTGMMFKGPKLCPKISPNKTISGAIGGLLFGTGGGIAVYAIFSVIKPFTQIFANANVVIGFVLLFSFLASLFCQIGDIFESLFKRKIGIKDTGTILAGHGGLMDRLDGISFATVIMFIGAVVHFV